MIRTGVASVNLSQYGPIPRWRRRARLLDDHHLLLALRLQLLDVQQRQAEVAAHPGRDDGGEPREQALGLEGLRPPAVP